MEKNLKETKPDKNVDKDVIIEDCLYCGNTGRTKEDPYHCKHCNRSYRDMKEPSVPILQEIYIPRKYKENIWDVNKLKENYKQIYPNRNQYVEACKWADVLELINNHIRQGLIYKLPFIYVSSFQNNSISRWSYKCLSDGEFRGYNVLGIKDLTDINLDLQDKDEIMNSDILFIRLTNYKMKENLEKLNYIIPERQSKDRMTVIISRLPYKYAVSRADFVTFNKPMLVQKQF